MTGLTMIVEWLLSKIDPRCSLLLLARHANLALKLHVQGALAIDRAIYDDPSALCSSEHSPARHGYGKFAEISIKAGFGFAGDTSLQGACSGRVEDHVGMYAFCAPGSRIGYRNTVIANQGVYEVDRAIGTEIPAANDSAFYVRLFTNLQVNDPEC